MWLFGNEWSHSDWHYDMARAITNIFDAIPCGCYNSSEPVHESASKLIAGLTANRFNEPMAR